METATDLIIAVTVTDRAGLDRQLDEAVTVAKAKAMEEKRHGILITRLDYSSFTVALSESVPFGLTREQQKW
jgi:hypothetical protein